MNSQNKDLYNLLQRFSTLYPDVLFIESEKSWWDPNKNTVHYSPKGDHPIWSILHEVGHMQAGHNVYKSDLELLKMEREAWENAKTLGIAHSIKIDNDHIEDCLDSYRDWLHNRSQCPTCNQTGMQTSLRIYSCPNCRSEWKVSNSRFCRTYRRKIKNTP